MTLKKLIIIDFIFFYSFFFLFTSVSNFRKNFILSIIHFSKYSQLEDHIADYWTKISRLKKKNCTENLAFQKNLHTSIKQHITVFTKVMLHEI